MPNTIQTRLNEISESMLFDLRHIYGDAEVEMKIFHSIEPNNSMTEMRFWEIIQTFDWSKGDPQDVLEPAIEILSKFSTDDIIAFHNILIDKLYALDGKRFAEHLGSNRYSDEKTSYFSVDDFLYSRCAVVANGRLFFNEVMFVPSKMPKEYTFESLLYLPQKAWQRKTGLTNYEGAFTLRAETFSNSDGWPGKKSLLERLQEK